MCVSLPIKFRADTKLVETGLHAYNGATYTFNVEDCVLAFTLSPPKIYLILQNVRSELCAITCLDTPEFLHLK